MSLKFLTSFFSALSTVAVTPLAFSKPEDADLNEKKFELQKCTLTNWGHSTAQLFKCQIGNKVWVFYLPVTWSNWFYGNTVGRSRTARSPGSGGAANPHNDLKNVVLTLETGHRKIVVTSGEKLNKELQVVWLESAHKDKRVFGYAPDSINKQTASHQNQGGQDIKQQMINSLEGIKPEISSIPPR